MTKAAKIEWNQVSHSKGDLWVGTVGGRKVAEVFSISEKWGGPDRTPHWSLNLGSNDDAEHYVVAKTMDSAKRAAQARLNKVVSLLLGRA